MRSGHGEGGEDLQAAAGEAAEQRVGRDGEGGRHRRLRSRWLCDVRFSLVATATRAMTIFLTVGAYGSWMARLDSGGSLNSEYGNGEGGQHRTNALLRDEMSSLLPRLEAGRVLGHARPRLPAEAAERPHGGMAESLVANGCWRWRTAMSLLLWWSWS